MRTGCLVPKLSVLELLTCNFQYIPIADEAGNIQNAYVYPLNFVEKIPIIVKKCIA
jgi:hypothetical protein